MRHVVWLAGCVLVVSCTVNSSNLNVDGGSPGVGGHIVLGTGGTVATGGTSGTGGTVATGGTTSSGGSGGDSCPRCAPTGGTTGTGGVTVTGGTTGTGGQSATGGTTGAGGQSATGGTTGAGGQSAIGGTGGSGGQSATGGQSGTGGQAGAGGGFGRSCSQLETAYSEALAAAKACTPGAPSQCKQLADNSIACPGCTVYVNDTKMLDTLEAQWTTSGCAQVPQACPLIACVVPTAATCVPNNSGPGSGGGICTSK